MSLFACICLTFIIRIRLASSLFYFSGLYRNRCAVDLRNFKKIFGTSGNSLAQIFAAERGAEVAKQLYGDLQKVTNNNFLVEGYSFGKWWFD